VQAKYFVLAVPLSCHSTYWSGRIRPRNKMTRSLVDGIVSGVIIWKDSFLPVAYKFLCNVANQCNRKEK